MADSNVTIAELTEKAKREFHRKAAQFVKEVGSTNKLFKDVSEQACAEYLRLFGRVGTAPLRFVKGAVQRPRYLLDRDECWVLYKPALWQMGGAEPKWMNRLNDLLQETNSAKNQCESKLIDSSNTSGEQLQVWHGLLNGLKWCDPDEKKKVKGWGFVQRLDVETDGPVVVAKTYRAQRLFQMQMKEHIFNKGYMCLVHGRMENRTSSLVANFVEMGSSVATQVMLRYDEENDPFYHVTEQGRFPDRGRSRRAKTFFKPLAYYRREADNTYYTLVYVNILSGITHQIRITMQAIGHPLVSDDRYLPKARATSDLSWCPRNFLTEVRSDFFDFCGPHKDSRRRLTRISIENPLPKLFQDVLEQKLKLDEVLDPSADLYVGCEYWALGDEQLMAAYPKDPIFRKKVMKWGIRRSISLDVLDRLLLLSQKDIEEVLQKYVDPSQGGSSAGWVCTHCMTWNPRQRWDAELPSECWGGAGVNTGTCEGRPEVDEEDLDKLCHGYLDYAQDPSFRLLLMVHQKWLDARMDILKKAAAAWDTRPPSEPEGTVATEDMMEALVGEVQKMARLGVVGVAEQDLKEIPGLNADDMKWPLALPPNGKLRRMRLPGKGTQSQWVYALKGKELLKISSKVDVKCKKYHAPVPVENDEVHFSRIRKKETGRELEKKERLDKMRQSGQEDWYGGPEESSPPAKRQKIEGAEGSQTCRGWIVKESTSNRGRFYWFNAEKNRSQEEIPEEVARCWQRRESTTNPGNFYWVNTVTDEIREKSPPGMKAAATAKESVVEEHSEWQRKESSSHPGKYYYFDRISGESSSQPPQPPRPWQVKESSTKPGQFYYLHPDSDQVRVDPPAGSTTSTSSAVPSRTNAAARPEELPDGWKRKTSASQGKMYYLSPREKSYWELPLWILKESKTTGKLYYENRTSGETSWEKPKTGSVEEK
jgi:23S rRNA-/tRNA-specific pseudouridylate synthase